MFSRMPVAAVPEPPPIAKRARGRPRKTDSDRDDGNRRQALLHAAAQLFRRQGFAATTTRDIASAVGMQSGSPFYFFKSKSALLLAVIEEGMHRALARQMQVKASAGYAHGTPAQQLRLHIQAHLEILLDPGNDFVPVMLYEKRALTPAQRTQLSQLVKAYEALWLPTLSTLHATGALGAPVHLARLLVFGALNWSVQWFDAGKPASIAELSEAALGLFLRPAG
jgi:AcrR family transcriptional regulator